MNWAIIVTVSLMLASTELLTTTEPAAMPALPATTAAPTAAPVRVKKVAAPARHGHVARAIVTRGISEREPIDELSKVSGDVPRLYFFTELHSMQGKRITHRWEHNGQLASETSFRVKGARWRSWSSKTLSRCAGAWRVHVVNSAGEILTTREFTCGGQ